MEIPSQCTAAGGAGRVGNILVPFCFCTRARLQSCRKFCVRTRFSETLPSTNSGAPYLAFFARCGKFHGCFPLAPGNFHGSRRLQTVKVCGISHISQRTRDMGHPSSWKGEFLKSSSHMRYGNRNSAPGETGGGQICGRRVAGSLQRKGEDARDQKVERQRR
jgi:hypothetical protein